ncbi:hypothetical protein B0F90DRAFT_1666744 [Multifurca ochricompacta]|uniref:Uncharacterized protein n=1 Tax=Multifurca ochricompacta TaxID=376703 RepID=A0AAD4M8M4_9AGAM|nr:hypothetical protein B0F90DRAFT_1666744 [Multifurca ochricompacta]
MSAPLPTPLLDPRKLANTLRRKTGRERHEERKNQLKDLASERYWRHCGRPPRQKSRRDNVSHINADAPYSDDEDEGVEVEVEVKEDAKVSLARSTSGATLLAMARPAKMRSSPPHITDGEAFEVVEIDGRLVALDEEGWEILPDESAQISLLYSDVVRSTAT